MERRMLFGFRHILVIGALATLSLSSCTSTQHPVAGATPSASPAASPTPLADAPSPSPSAPEMQRGERSLPVALEESGAAAAGGRLFVIGGFDAVGTSLRNVWVFDGSAWSAGPRLPLGLDHTSAAALDDHVYLAGGHSFGRDSARLFRLDGSSWTELASMHHARGGHALIAAAGKLYAIGGNNAFSDDGQAEVYDPNTRAWTDLRSLPAPRDLVSGFVFGANVCVAARRSPAPPRDRCVKLDRAHSA